MINKYLHAVLLLILMSVTGHLSAQSTYTNNFTWSEYPEIPPPPGSAIQPGLASSFAGSVGNVIIVAGGCNFPELPVRDGGIKRYYDDAFVFTQKDGNWQWLSGFQLPRATAYGASVSLPEGLLCIGGNGSDGDYKMFIF